MNWPSELTLDIGGMLRLPRWNVIVEPRMAASTKRYEIILLVAAEETSRLNVVYLKVFQAAAMLAAPPITGQNTLP